MSKLSPKLYWQKRMRIDLEVAKMPTDELEALLSPNTVTKIERHQPVSYRSACLFCKALGLDPYQTIIVERKIPIMEEITEQVKSDISA